MRASVGVLVAAALIHPPTAGGFITGRAVDFFQGGTRQTEPTSTGIPIHSVYGTLAFRGEVQRFDFGERYEFHVTLAATFRAGEKLNAMPTVALRNASLIAAAAVVDRSQPAKVLYRDVRAVDLVLNTDGETKRLPPLTFHLAKSLANEAATVGIAVSDGRVMWPITLALK